MMLHGLLGRVVGASVLVVAVGCASPKKDEPQGPGGEGKANDGVAAARQEAPVPAAADGEDTNAVTQAEPVSKEPPKPVWKPRAEDELTPEHEIDFPEALAYFYDALAEVDDGKQELVTVVHLGASMIGQDDLPAIMREKFQSRFGDGGAGLVLLQRYMGNYKHRWVKLRAGGWEHCYIAYLCKRDGHYGLGGVTFWSDGGAKTRIATREDELGDEVSRFELWYAAHKWGGKIELKVDDREPVLVDTAADELEDRYHEIDVEQGPHAIRVRARGRGRKVRAYGVLLETDGPGVVWDQFSMLGAFTKRMLGWDEKHIAGHIEHRDPELVAFQYGGNDSRRVALGKLTREKYAAEYTKAVKKVMAGKPEASCIIIGLTDRSRSLSYKISSDDMETLVGAQRDTAEACGCAFFDSYHAMGGPNSLRDWRRKQPPLAAPDMKHLNHAGREVLGGWIYDALIAGYVRHRTDKAKP